MPGPSKVIVLDPDARAGRQVLLGFEREGIPAAMVAAEAPLDLPVEDTGLVVVGGSDGQGVELVRRARRWLDDNGADVPIVFAGRGVTPGDASDAGADEVLRRPAYLRDVVTIGRLMRGLPAGHRDHIVGNLLDVTGVFTLVRALAALGRSATLTLVRGLRRGEVRFYYGEVTSAQTGMIHGQAALHQLLLWTDARFDFHHQEVVRRQQIPLPPDELFADAERFLAGVRESSGGLSPAMVLEQDTARVQSFARQIPTEVHGLLRMFDGHRALADVLEDSAYRVFETLRVAQRAVEAGLLRAVDQPPPTPRWRTILAVEDWLVGTEPRDAVVDSGPIAKPERDSGPATARDGRGASGAGKPARKRKKKKRTAPAVPAAAAPTATGSTATAGSMAAAAPTASAEIDWGALVPRIVGAEVGPLAGVVPSTQVAGEIVTSTAAAPDGAAGSSPRHAPDGAANEPTIVFDEATELARDAAALRAEAEAHAEVERISATVHAVEEAERVAMERRAAAEAKRAAAQAEWAMTQAEAERAAAQAYAAAEAERAAAQAEADAHANAIRIVAATVSVSSAPAPVVTDTDLIETKRERGFVALREARAAVEAAQAEAAVAEPAEAAVAEPAEATVADPIEAAITEPAHAAARARAAALATTALDDDTAAEPVVAAVAEAAEAAPPETTAPVDPVEAAVAEPVDAAVAESDDAAVADLVDAAVSDAVTAPIIAMPAPSEVSDEPSDGVVRHHIATAETAPVRRRPPGEPVDDDRPAEATGEITMPQPRPAIRVRHSEPSILVAELDPADEAALDAADEAALDAARGDAAHFDELEEEFFRAGHDPEAVAPPQAPPAESFDDLDEGYRKVGFWERLRRKPR